jgi:hypothetical protein
MQPALVGNGLSIATKLAFVKHIVCASQQAAAAIGNSTEQQHRATPGFDQGLLLRGWGYRAGSTWQDFEQKQVQPLCDMQQCWVSITTSVGPAEGPCWRQSRRRGNRRPCRLHPAPSRNSL